MSANAIKSTLANIAILPLERTGVATSIIVAENFIFL